MSILKRSILLLLLAASFPLVSVAQQISLDDVLTKGTFRQSSVRGLRSMKDGVHYTTLEGEGTKIVKYSYKSGKEVETVLKIEDLGVDTLQSVFNYIFSPNETKVMLLTGKKQIYRHSFTAQHYIYNFVTKQLAKLSDNGSQQVATFSPNGEAVAFVRDNNLFMKNLRFGTERQVTYDGEFNKVINGVPDWVYEEEFSFTRAFEWSPDSRQIAYMKFNEEAVSTFEMTIFKGQSPERKEYDLYPKAYKFKYPKAGEKNSIVEVYVYDIKARQSVKVNTGDETDIYIPRIRWTHSGNDLSVFQLNRLQNKLVVLFANPNTGDTRTIYNEKNDRYIDASFFDNLTYLPDNKHFVVLSEQDGYSHLYLYSFLGTKVRQLTEGEFDVTKFYGYDPTKKLFYYQAAAVSPLQREVYAVSIDTKKRYKLSKKKGTNSAAFSKGYKYYINNHTSVDSPLTVTLHSQNGKQIRVLEDNKELIEKLSTYNLPKKEFFSFETSEGVELNGWMIKPVGFSDSKEYPLLMTQYSGPNSQMVIDRHSIDWYYYLAQEGYVVACVDPRGTGARGEDFRKCTYMQLGKYESDDQIEAANYLSSLPFVDGENIGIWGWSYGGFVSSICIAKGANIFKAAIAVAPVTHFKYYDTVYTERYMRTPQNNADGYNDNAPINMVSDIKGRFLLVHGSADDNVHVQNSVEMAEAMVQNNIQFQQMIYTNRNHGIRGGNTTKHLYTMFVNFLSNSLKQ